MQSNILTIKGKIIGSNQAGIPDLKVEAWDKDLILDDLVGSAVTGSDGAFEITFTRSYFSELFFDRKPDLFFKIFKEGKLIHSTENHVLWNASDTNDNIIIEVNETAPPQQDEQRNAISGTVKHVNGNVINDVAVRLSEKMIRAEKTLQQTKTTKDGSYSFAFQSSGKNASFIVEVLDADTKVIAASDVLYAPLQKVTIDLTVTDDRYKGQAFFIQNTGVLQSFLDDLTKSSDTKVTVDDIYFIATKTGKEPTDVWHWVKANNLQTASQIPAEAFYGLFKEGFPADTEGMLSQDPQAFDDAFKNAAAKGFISDDVANKGEAIKTQWQQYMASQVLEPKPVKMDASLGDALSIVIEDKKIQQNILQSYISNTGTIESFWENLSQVTGDEKSVQQVQRVIQFSALTGNQPAMTKALMADSSQSGAINPLSKLAERDEDEWKNYIHDLSNKQGSSVVPSVIKADNEDDRISVYAGTIASSLATAFPTQAFFGRLIKTGAEQNAFSTSQKDLGVFYNNNPQFDIKSSSTISMTGANSGFNFSGVENKSELIVELQTIQRLSALSADFKVVNALKKNGLQSSYDVMQMTQTQFIQSYSPVFGSAQNTIYAYKTAQKNYYSSLAVYAKLTYQLNFGTTVTPTSPLQPGADPTLRTLFGSLDVCECEQCTSVFSAAAYYADILNFLYKRSPDVYAELIRRRPDLPFIELTCENTNTPLPYVDLAIELLENFVLTHKSPPQIVTGSFQTTWQPAELSANPEHLSYDAYDELIKAVYPHALPFNFPLEETRVYLKHLGVQRHQLMKAFFAGTEEEAFDDFNICMERLLISPQGAKILTGETTGDGTANTGTWNFYGFDKETGYTPLTDPVDSGEVISGGNWNDALSSRVDVFLQQTELVYKELLMLLLCNFINPIIGESRKITIVTKAKDQNGDDVPPDTCELDLLELNGLDVADLKKIHRFLRLWRKLGWTMYELDEAATAFNITDFNNDNTRKNDTEWFTQSDLKKISQTWYFTKQLNLTVEKTLALWSPVNSTATYVDWFTDNYPLIPSLYEKLFRNKAVLNPVDVAFTEDPSLLTGNMDDHTAALFAGLQTGDTDYNYLKADASVIADTNLTLANLSSLFRYITIAQKLRLSIKDFISLTSLIALNPFTSPADTFQFLQKADTVKASGFSIDLINYLINHIFLQETTVAPDDTSIGDFLSELRAALRGISTSAPDDQRNLIAQKFSEKLKITTTASSMLLHTYIKSTANAAVAIEEDFRADDFSTSVFLKAYPDPSDSTKEAEPVFVRTADGTDPLQVAVPVLFDDYLKLDKIATFINKLKLSDTDVENVLKSSSLIGCTDLSSLPVTPTAGDFDSFEILIHLIQARDNLPVGTPDYFDILNQAINTPDAAADSNKQAAKDLWLAGITTRTNWDRATIEALTGDKNTLINAGILQTDFPANFRNGDLILTIRNCFGILNKIGLNTSLIASAITADVDGNLSQAVKNAAKSKYDEAQWLALAKPLRDVLRDLQREALVAYTIAHPSAAKHEQWKNSDELYEYLLIDVEMKPISMTSRIKQAICSVQLYIDRVLMNLEHPNVDSSKPVLQMDGDQADEWKEWRKIYRIWEANRKIFLYPENWLEPELRDDKSPFFEELEAQLMQNELNDDNVEQAFNNYLEKLDGVARLEVIGIYHQLEDATADEEAVDIVHVIARTYSTPNKYYHRTFEFSEWTAWEKLEIDVDGDHIVPVIFNRRLCLFWLFFTEEGAEKDSIDPKSTVTNSPRYVKIQVAWSEFKYNKWTAKKISKRYVYTGGYTIKPAYYLNDIKRTTFVHSSLESNGNLRLQLLNNSYWFLSDKIVISTSADLRQAVMEAAFIFNDANSDPYPDNITYGDYDNNNSAYYANQRKYPYILPPNTDYNENMLQETAAGNALYYDSYKLESNLYYVRSSSQKVLGNTGEGRYNLVVPSSYDNNPLSAEFFLQDQKNTFYVVHSKVEKSIIYTTPSQVSLGDWFIEFGDKYYQKDPDPILQNPGYPLVDPEIYFSESFNQSFLAGVNNSFGGVNTNAVTLQKVLTSPGAVSFSANPITAKSNVAASEETASADVTAQPMMTTVNNDTLSVSAQRDVAYLTNYEYAARNSYYAVRKFYYVDRFAFYTFYHNNVKTFIHELNKNGIKGLLQRKLQDQPDNILFSSSQKYAPTSLVLNTTDSPYPDNKVDFAYGSAYGQYNWELFFHTPMLIACRLSVDQRFDEARDWFHYIFDPTNSDGGNKERFWQFLPFWQEAQNKIETLDDLLRNEAELNEQVNKWMEYPFQPHVIARMRISAYMKNVVMKYLDNLIAWGDQLFSQDTIEAINEATNLYILAAEILGERPQQIPPRAKHADYTFDELKDMLDDFSDALVNIETFISPSASSTDGTSGDTSNALGKMFFFCIPGNDYLLKYWDTIADRLFKIRHSMNIEGVVRTLPLFEPPIDPGMLVRAAAAGMDLSSILSDLTAPLPYYRFAFVLQKANEFCNEVKSLGSSLLQALEKRDAESMALLRLGHEQQLLKAVLAIKENSVNDSKAILEGVQKSMEIANLKYEYYNSRPYMNPHEQQHLTSMQTGMILSMVQGEIDTVGSALAAIPNLKAGSPTTIGVTWGGDNLGQMMHAISQYLGIIAAVNNTTGAMSATLGGYDRRKDDWQFQAQSAKKEIEQLEKQILSSEIKLAIAQKDFDNQKLQIDNAKEEEDFMQSKFTNRQLYEWMIGQVSTVYFQSYQLAYDLAKKAEQCYQNELGKYGETSFIQFGYWDSLKKGLLSAEKLQYDLRRMETSFYTANKREFELSKNVSLLFLSPASILDLKQNGSCTFILPEALYDLDFQGHYFRRIKSVALSIPCIIGPYTTIGCTLRLLKHTTRLNTSGAAYESSDYTADDRFRYVTTETHSVAISTAQNDGGLFEVNFKDERYLPFEGCGAFGEWQLELNGDADLRMFDYNTISDVIVHIKYTAREDAGPFKDSVVTYLKSLLTNTAPVTASSDGAQLWRMFSLKHEFPTEWYNMLHTAIGLQQMVILLDNKRFPYFAQNRNIQIKTVHVYGLVNVTDDYTVEVSSASGNATKQTLHLTTGNEYHDSKDVSGVSFNLGLFTIHVTRTGAVVIGDNDLKDVFVVLEYQFV